ncbi:hypothetical protein JOF56_010881 [Kibdelosporangium banguiense]|uniref:Methane oxygenase PmoA n=1 Tax=Kibdelosporangium banguiense TaxID=1365924 RepID=A0ABS4U1I2_9PSEU|nr:PmoA family protein [Kibdelosporangium banguiense]MBP2330496.1 hypothetical protein [Kibdelosporangium banguiense]
MSLLSLRGKIVAEYVIDPDIDPTLVPRPYLHPVRTLTGTAVTDVLPEDHEWHLGAGIAMPDVSGTNLWGGRTYVHGQGYVWLPDHGRIVHTGWRSQSDNAFAHDLHWLSPNGTTLLEEQREIRAEAVDDRSWRLTVSTRLTNPGKALVELRTPALNGRGEGAGYGGFFWRLPPTIDVELSAGSLRAESAINGSATPELTVSSARYSLTFSGLADNDRWFARIAEYPGIGASLAFDQPLVIGPGCALSRTYHVVIADR